MVIINHVVIEDMERAEHLVLSLDSQGKSAEQIAEMLGQRLSTVKKTIGSKKLKKLFDKAMAGPR